MTCLAVVFGGPSPEHDVSILTGLQAARSLEQRGADVTCLYWTKSGSWLRVPAALEAPAFLEPEIPGASPIEFVVPDGFVERRRLRANPLEIDVVLNCCHGGPGEDGVLTGMLLLAGLRVTGPTPQAAALAMDKLAMGALAEAVGVPTPRTCLVVNDMDPAALPDTPWVVKPRFGGSSLGIEVDVSDLDTARALAKTGIGRSGMVLQTFLAGWQDINVAVRTWPRLECSAIERPLRDTAAIYSYADKYLTGGVGMDAAPRELPAVLPAPVEERVRAYALRIVSAAGIHGAPRIDFLWDGGDELVLCEVNSIPGAWANHLWVAAGVGQGDFYHQLVDEALASRPGLPQWVGSTDGQALRVSGSIAAKLV